ncbi:MAG TPA: 3'-5' exonuclease [Candidatus Ozemobacteraceae bacterium]|nr:3'-5' exonuclease [Candidatus Ozemobacteraceae bacterium]
MNHAAEPFAFEHTPIRALPFVTLDLETTGFAPPAAKVTEVAMISIVEDTEESFHTLIDPGEPIPAEIIKLTGITDEMVKGKPTIREVVPIMAGILQGSIFVSHNVPFDWSFISHAWREYYNVPLQMPSMCTLRLSRRYLGLASNKLGIVARHLCVELTDAHRAMGDTLAVKGVLKHLITLLEGKGLRTGGDLLRAGLIHPTVPPAR